MSKATGRAVFAAAILALIIGLIVVNVFAPPLGMTVQLEEAGLIGALIAGLTTMLGYYFGKD